MERNRDYRRASVSSVNGLPRRRLRITGLRDSADEDRQTELKEAVRFRDRERSQKKERDREFTKRRRVDRSVVQQRSGGGSGGGDSYRENESTDSSDDEYYGEEEEVKLHHHKGASQSSPVSTSLSNNRRGLRTLRSSPVIRFPSDEILGVPIPRRARSVSAKRLQKRWISVSMGFGEDLSHRRLSPATAMPIGFGGGSPSSSGDSMKNKMKSAAPRNRGLNSESNSKPSAIQDEIEIEVAEALFDLMKQSQSQPSKIQEKVERDRPDTADCEMLKAEGGEGDNNAFSVQNEQSKEANAETIVADMMKDLKKERRVEKEKFSDDPADELVGGDGFVNKGTLGSPKENKSLSCVKVNACDIKDPTVTKAEHGATVAESKKETKVEIDLMASPPLPSSPERDTVVEIELCPKVTSRVGQKKSETISENGLVAVAREAVGVLNANQLLDLDFEKRRHDTLSDSSCMRQHHQGQKEQKSQSTSLFPFPIGMSSWPGVLPHPGYMPPLQTDLPIDGSARSSMTMRPPQFKLSQPRTRRCTTHQYIAQNIDHHQKLVKKALSSVSTGPVTSYGTMSLNPKAMLPTQIFTHGNSLETIMAGSGKDKSLGAAAASSVTPGAKPVLQQASNQVPATNIMHGPGFMFPLGHHHGSMMVPTSSSGPPQSASAVGGASLTCDSAGKPSNNLSFPGGAAAVSFNHPIFPSNGTAPYMTILQSNGGPVPISTNIPMPSFKGVSPSMPLFNSSPYSSSMFNVNNQQQFAPPHTPVQSSSQNTVTVSGSSSRKQPECQQKTSTISENKIPTSAAAHPMIQPIWPSYSSGKSEPEIVGKSSPVVADSRVPHSVKSNNHTGSFPVQPMNYTLMPPLSIGGGGAAGNKNGDHSQHGSKGRVELMPPVFALSFGTNPSTDPVAANFSSTLQNPALFQMLPDMVRNGAQMAQQKNFQSSEGKFPSSGDHSFNFPKSDGTDMSASSTMVTSKFDGLPRTVYYPSSLSGNQPLQSSSVALASGVSPTIPNFQQQHHQQQLTQLQQHQVHQMQLTGAAQMTALPPATIPGSFLGSSFPNNSPGFAAQPDISSFPAKWMNFPRTTPPEGSSQPATPALGNISQLKSSQGQTHITFGNGSAAAAPLQGQHIMIKPESSMTARPTSSISKNTGSSLNPMPSTSALASQETGATPNGLSQKSPPACRRNIPSILSTCPSQLPELKY